MATKKENIDNPKSCLNQAHHDEPIFVLRGKDSTAPKVILHWIAKNFEARSKEKLLEAFNCALAMKDWRHKYFTPLDTLEKERKDDDQ